MSNLPIAGIVLAAFFSALIVSKKSKKVHDYILLSWLILIGLHQLYYYINFIEATDNFQPFLIIGSFFPFLYGPIIFLYVISLIRKRKVNHVINFLHFLPFIYYSVSTVIFYFINDGSYILQVYDGYLHRSGNLPLFLHPSYFMALSGGIYPIVCLWLLQKHKNNIKSEFSYTEHINLDWLKYWIISSFASFLIIFFLLQFSDFELIKQINPFKLVSLTVTIFLIVISYYGFKQTAIFVDYDKVKIKESQLRIDNEQIENNVLDKEVSKIKYAKSGITKEQSQKYIEILLKYLDESKPYLDNKLSLKLLSDNLQISTNHISQVINEHFKLNFFDFINKYRVEEVKQKFSDKKYQNFTILAIAFECGFNSKSAFNNAFKRFTGYTPSQYKNTAQV